jgi:peptidoglycan/LPS O-acetylase OafA/YrhL
MRTLRDRYRSHQENSVKIHSGWFPRWRNRRVRRPLALTWLVCAVAAVAITPIGGASAAGLGGWATLVAITVMLQSLIKVLTDNIGERTARLLDERELALRGRCSYVGYLVAVWSMVIAAFVLALTPLRESPHGPFVLLISLVALASNTPSALLCWQLPDDEPDPIAEGDSRG